MTDFKIKTYGKAELACLYRPCVQPKSAVKTLIAWIMGNKQLADALAKTGYDVHNKTFTPLQVSIIVRYIGPP